MTNRFTRVKVSPATAQRWLKDFNYADNRPISRSWVDYLSRQMVKGLWKDNGEPLIFDHDGHLLDGQHRLSAVVQSATTQTFDVRRGVETDVFTTIDQGRGRSGAQVLGMLGEKNSSLLAALCRMAYQWETHGTVFVGRRVSPDELALVLDVYGDKLREATERAVTLRKSKLPLEGSTAAFCYFLFAQVSKRKADSFFDVLESGCAETRHHPAVTLYRRLFSESVANTRRRLPRKAGFALVIRAWNYHHANKTVTKLAIKMDGDGSFKVPTIRGAGKGQCNQGGKKWQSKTRKERS